MPGSRMGSLGAAAATNLIPAAERLLGCLLGCNMLAYLRNGSAQTNARAATLRQKLQITLSHPIAVY